MAQPQAKRPPSQRQLRVGEELRHALAEVLFRGETHEPELESLSITVSEVRISPDLKNATAYCTPLAGGGDAEKVIKKLNEVAPLIRKLVNKRIVLKYSPKLFFKLDKSFDEANRINQLLHLPNVVRDLSKNDEEPSE